MGKGLGSGASRSLGLDRFTLKCSVDRQEMWSQAFRGEVWAEDLNLDVINSKLAFITRGRTRLSEDSIDRGRRD